jgi:hypothetical protein
MAWKTGAVAAIVATAAWLVHTALVVDRIWEAYPTSIPAVTFLAISAAATLIFAGLVFGGTLLGAALAGGLFPAATHPLRASIRRVAGLDAALAGVVGCLLLAGCSAMEDVIAAVIPGGRVLSRLAPPTAFEATVPALDVLVVSLLVAILVAACGAIAAAAIDRYLKAVWARALLAALLIAGFGPAVAYTAAERITGAAIVATWVAALVVFAALYLRRNPLAWLTAPFTALAVWNGFELATAPNDFYRWNGIAVLVFVACVLIWLAAGTRRQTVTAVSS